MIKATWHRENKLQGENLFALQERSFSRKAQGRGRGFHDISYVSRAWKNKGVDHEDLFDCLKVGLAAWSVNQNVNAVLASVHPKNITPPEGCCIAHR